MKSDWMCVWWSVMERMREREKKDLSARLSLILTVTPSQQQNFSLSLSLHHKNLSHIKISKLRIYFSHTHIELKIESEILKREKDPFSRKKYFLFEANVPSDIVHGFECERSQNLGGVHFLHRHHSFIGHLLWFCRTKSELGLNFFSSEGLFGSGRRTPLVKSVENWFLKNSIFKVYALQILIQSLNISPLLLLRSD